MRKVFHKRRLKTTQVLCRLISNLTEKPTSQSDFGKIGKVLGETAVTPREGKGEERASDLAQSSGETVYLVPDAWSTIQQNEIVHKNSKGDVL